jgi:hypothetical protein
VDNFTNDGSGVWNETYENYQPYDIGEYDRQIIAYDSNDNIVCQSESVHLTVVPLE